MLIGAAVAAPSVTPADISGDSLKDIASERQRESIAQHEKAKEKAEKAREEAAQQARKQTEENDKGLKDTIRRRHLNNMLPPCDREPEAPRDPQDYRIRY